jgi:hypothetical protein
MLRVAMPSVSAATARYLWIVFISEKVSPPDNTTLFRLFPVHRVGKPMMKQQPRVALITSTHCKLYATCECRAKRQIT